MQIENRTPMKQSKSSIFQRKSTPHKQSRVLKFRKSKSDRSLNTISLNTLICIDDESVSNARRQSFGQSVKLTQIQYSKSELEDLKYSTKLVSQHKKSPLNSIGKKIKRTLSKVGLSKRKMTPIFNRNISNKSIEFWEEEMTN